MAARPGGEITTQPRSPCGIGAPFALLALLSILCSLPPAFAQDEFLLNDDRVARNQWAPSVARGSTGNLVVAWMDGRNTVGSTIDFDTYLMTLRDPSAIGSTVNRRVNDDAPGATQAFPAIAASPAGTYFCVWEDGRAGHRDIYGSTLDSIGVRLTPNLRMNDDTGFTEQANPQITSVGANEYLVLWGDQRQEQGEIFASRLTSSGAPIGPNFKISVDPVVGGSYQGEPAAAARADGLTLVAWLDGREGGTTFGATFDVYGQLLDAAAQPLGPNFKINDTMVPQRNTSISVAADPTGGFVVAWIDRRAFPTDPGDVFAQRIGAGGGFVGVNIRVNTDPLGKEQRSVRALAVPGSAFLIWEDLRGNLGLDSNVEAANVPFDASPAGVNFRVNVSIPARQGTPAAAWDGRDAVLAVWEAGRNGPPDIYALSILPDSTRRGSETQLNDDAAGGDQRRPRVGRGSARFLATWTDRRSGTNDLFAQWVTSAGGRDGPNHRVFGDDGTSRPVSAHAAVASGGVALLVAHVTRESDAGEIRGFTYTGVGTTPASSFWISDSLPSAQSTPRVTTTSAGFSTAWLDTREGATRLYGQRFSPSGGRIGANHAVLQIEPADPVFDFDLDYDPMGGHWLLYAEGAAIDQRLWLVHLDSNLTADRDPMEIAPSAPGRRNHPSLGVGPDGRVEVVWVGDRAGDLGQSYHQAFNSGGFPISPVAALGAADGLEEHAAPSISVSGTRSIVTWEAMRDGNWSIWLQAFDGGTMPATGLLRVDQDILGADQFDPSVGLDPAGQAVVIWSDARSASSGTDIVGRVFSLGPTGIEDPPTPEPGPGPPPPAPPFVFRMGPAAPNPFAGSLGIPLEVPAGSSARVTVRVIGVRGEVVATLHDGPLASARSLIRWDGTNGRSRLAASGVYWIVAEMGKERRALRVVQLQ